MGGTNILRALKVAFNLKTGSRFKRIFLLTDGEVDNVGKIVNVVKKNNNKARVHTFGIGSDCDRNLIMQTAIAGRGSFSFAMDNSPMLSG